MITLKYNQIANPNFVTAVGTLLEMKVPVRTAVSIKKSIDVINSELKTFNELREGYIKKYGVELKDDKGEPSGWSLETASVENQKECIGLLNELFLFEFEIPLESPVELKDDIEIDTKSYMLLSDLVTVK